LVYYLIILIMATKKTTPKSIRKEEMKKEVLVKPTTKEIKTGAKLSTKTIKNIEQALFMFQGEAIVLPRNGTGKSKSGATYKYVTLDDLINGTRPFLMKYGIGFTQLVNNDKLNTVLFHSDSDTKMTSEINLGSPKEMQDYGSRITYARRYSLQSILGLSAEEDTDAVPTLDVLNTLALKNGSDSVKVPGFIKPSDGVANIAQVLETATPPVEDKPSTVRSEAYIKAHIAIETSYGTEALDLIKDRINASARLNDEEKASLLEVAKARDVEINGTVNID